MPHPSPARWSLLLRLLLGLSLRSLVSDRLAVRLRCKSLPRPRRSRCRRRLLSALLALRPCAGPHGLNLASLPDSAGLSAAVPSRAQAVVVRHWQYSACAYVRARVSLTCINWRRLLTCPARKRQHAHSTPTESSARDIFKSRAPGARLWKHRALRASTWKSDEGNQIGVGRTYRGLAGRDASAGGML